MTDDIQLTAKKNIYFASDFHLGIPDNIKSRERERLLVQWLSEIENDAAEIYLVGDVFDFWFEYKTVIPKGYVRLLGKLAELREKGISIYFFTGNHDLWMFGYFEDELNIPVFDKPIAREFNGRKFLIGHGDGLGPGDKGYKMMKKIFRNRFCQFLFRWVHPDIGIKIARSWSRYSRMGEEIEQEKFQGEEGEWLIQYCNKKLQEQHIDYFVFGHRHLPIEYQLPGNSKYINLGDWLYFYTYAVFDGENLELKYYKGKR